MTSKLLAACLLVACGGDVHHTGDAGLPDAAVDALSPSKSDAPAHAVTLSVTVGAMPTSGVPVYFQNADSSLVNSVLTDAAGTAFAVMAPGGFVTAIEPSNGSGVVELSTFAGVQPDDALRLDLLPVLPMRELMFQLTVPTLANAQTYTVYTPCGTAMIDVTGTGTVRLAGCGTLTDVLVVALDANGTAIGTLFGGGVSVGTAPVTLTGTYAPEAATTYTYTDVPPPIPFVKTYAALTTTRGRLFSGTTSSAAAGSTTNSITLPDGTGATRLVVSDAVPTSSELGEQLVYDWGAWSPSYALDFGSVMLPRYASAPTYDPASRTVAWTEAAGGVAPDLVRTRIHAYRDDIPTGTAWGWRLIAPRKGTAVSYPQLPVDGFDYNPSATDVVGVDDLTIALVPGGFAATVRDNGFVALSALIAGMSGHMVVELPYVPNL